MAAHLNITQNTISDEKPFRNEPYSWVDGISPILEHQYQFCADVCLYRQGESQEDAGCQQRDSILLFHNQKELLTSREL